MPGLAGRSEAGHDSELAQLLQALARGPRASEVQAAELLRRQHAVLVAVECDGPVAVGQPSGERGQGRAAARSDRLRADQRLSSGL